MERIKEGVIWRSEKEMANTREDQEQESGSKSERVRMGVAFRVSNQVTRLPQAIPQLGFSSPGRGKKETAWRGWMKPNEGGGRN